MRNFGLTLALLSTPVVAAELNCSTPSTEALEVVLTASVAEPYAEGLELKALRNVKVIAGSNTEEHATIEADAYYSPRGNKNRVRFSLDGVDASTDAFDGIVHGFILPKALTASEILQRSNGQTIFRAKVISSTDSYHDGVMSYFNLHCKLTRAD